MVKAWNSFSEKHPGLAQFLMFFIVSNGITVLQMVLMPALKFAFEMTPLIETNFQLLQVGSNLDGSPFYVFDYARGAIAAGGGGGLAYFLAVQITLGIAQIINFFVQRNVTFKSNSDIKKAAAWYVVAYLIISTAAAALQGLYKVPIYTYFIGLCGDSLGVTIADIITMIINCAISFWVFFPIFKIIFKEKPENN
ncbi:MAG: hypothetical protein ACRDDX_07955 [Cellulosilyticaceae bacterium]